MAPITLTTAQQVIDKLTAEGWIAVPAGEIRAAVGAVTAVVSKSPVGWKAGVVITGTKVYNLVEAFYQKYPDQNGYFVFQGENGSSNRKSIGEVLIHGVAPPWEVVAPPPPPPPPPPVVDPVALKLFDGRFLASVSWVNQHATPPQAGNGTPVPLTPEAGVFWFFSGSNLELLVVMVDGTGANGFFWVKCASATDVEFTLTVKDTSNGAVKTYHNEPGKLASFIDIDAFASKGAA